MKVSSKCPSFLPKASVGIQSREEPREVFLLGYMFLSTLMGSLAIKLTNDWFSKQEVALTLWLLMKLTTL